MVGEYTDTVDQLMKSIASLDNVTEYSLMRDLTLNSWINQESMAKELHEQVNKDKSMLKNGKYRYDIDLHALNEENLQAYADKIGADYEQLVNLDNLTGIVIDTIPYKDREAGKL
jgi:putative ABC transport system permease protein